MDVIGVPTEAQIKRMQGIIAMLQSDKKSLMQRTEQVEEQNTILQSTINKLAKQAEDATNKLELLTTENTNLVNELQVNIYVLRIFLLYDHNKGKGGYRIGTGS